jgi:hypothetical protein
VLDWGLIGKFEEGFGVFVLWGMGYGEVGRKRLLWGMVGGEE